MLAHRGGIDWKFFTTGTSLLFGGHPPVISGITGGSAAAGPAGLPGPRPPGGLDIFGDYPALQMGPLAYLATGVLRQIGPDNGLVAVELFLQACGLAIVYLMDRIATLAWAAPGGASRIADRGYLLTLLASGAVFIVAWSELAAGFAHLDDGLALLLAVLAVRAAIGDGSRSYPVLTGVCVGLAADAKPWALVFLPVILIAGRKTSDVTVAALAVLGMLTVAWAPFFAADPGTMHAAHYLIRNEPDSALRALGVRANYTPSWDRPSQVLLGCVLGILVVWRGRWPGVLLLAGGARVLLDPAAHSYYTPDVMTGALLWDLLGPRRPVPLWSIVSFAALNVVPLLTHDRAAQGTIRLALIAVFTAAVLALPPSRYATGSPPRQTRRGASP